jgi:hypothetical protein
MRLHQVQELMALILATTEGQVRIGYCDSQNQEQREWLKVAASLVLLEDMVKVCSEDGRCLWIVPQQAGSS